MCRISFSCLLLQQPSAPPGMGFHDSAGFVRLNVSDVDDAPHDVRTKENKQSLTLLQKQQEQQVMLLYTAVAGTAAAAAAAAPAAVTAAHFTPLFLSLVLACKLAVSSAVFRRAIQSSVCVAEWRHPL
jgi:hypothetical protein